MQIIVPETRYHMFFFVWNIEKKMDNDRNNYLKYLSFEICIRYCFEFASIGNDGDHVYFLVGDEPKYYPQ